MTERRRGAPPPPPRGRAGRTAAEALRRRGWSSSLPSPFLVAWKRGREGGREGGGKRKKMEPSVFGCFKGEARSRFFFLGER